MGGNNVDIENFKSLVLVRGEARIKMRIGKLRIKCEGFQGRKQNSISKILVKRMRVSQKVEARAPARSAGARRVRKKPSPQPAAPTRGRKPSGKKALLELSPTA